MKIIFPMTVSRTKLQRSQMKRTAHQPVVVPRKRLRLGLRVYEPDLSLVQRHAEAPIFSAGVPFLRHLLVDFAQQLPVKSHYVTTVQMCGPLVCKHFYDVIKNTVRQRQRAATRMHQKNYLRMCLALRSEPLLRECRLWLNSTAPRIWVQDVLHAAKILGHSQYLYTNDSLEPDEVHHIRQLVCAGRYYVMGQFADTCLLRRRVRLADVLDKWRWEDDPTRYDKYYDFPYGTDCRCRCCVRWFRVSCATDAVQIPHGYDELQLPIE